MEKAENFHQSKLLTKSFTAFQAIHLKWNYPPEEEIEVLKTKLYEKEYLDKLRLFHKWKYVTTCILKPNRLLCEKADVFYTQTLKRRAFFGIMEVNDQFRQVELGVS